MLLVSLSVRDFQCYEEINNLPIERLCVFIGENDSGKTALLDAIRILVTNDMPKPADYRLITPNGVSETITISGSFLLDSFDSVPAEFLMPDNRHIEIVKTFSIAGGNKCYVNSTTFEDPRLLTFASLSAEIQKDILVSAGIEPGKNAAIRVTQFEEGVAEGVFPKAHGLKEVRFADLISVLPRFEYISSSNYQQPDTLVQSTLRTALNNCIKPLDPQTNQPVLIPELTTAKGMVEQALNTKIKEVGDLIKTYNPKVNDISVESSIDFARSLGPSKLMLDMGLGFQFIEAFGEGTKKKLWMSLLEWDRITQKEVRNTSIIRAYDEPDVNLDYSAERKLFSNILDITSSPGSSIQSFISTHSMTMVDRAPAKSVYLIQSQDVQRRIEHIKSDNDEQLELFLTTVGRSLGITNSALFYEKAFIVVEGESEENCLPILYKHVYGRALIEDGIVLVNLKSCGAWSQILKILLRNKSHLTVLLLDNDVKNGGTGVNITPSSLRSLGFPSSFVDNHCLFAGIKEFEDTFNSADIAELFNLHWPKVDGIPWEPDEIELEKTQSKKFSDTLKSLLFHKSQSHVSKPTIALKMAEFCTDYHQVPEVVRSAFGLARRLAGIDETPQTTISAVEVTKVV